jgi:hypothetical protein
MKTNLRVLMTWSSMRVYGQDRGSPAVAWCAVTAGLPFFGSARRTLTFQ